MLYGTIPITKWVITLLYARISDAINIVTRAINPLPVPSRETIAPSGSITYSYRYRHKRINKDNYSYLDPDSG